MSHQSFTTYLEKYRLQAGFSRAELAFLLGTMNGHTVTRHARGDRVPALRTILAYSLILGAPVERLYEGMQREIQEELRGRARGLRRLIGSRAKNRKNVRKMEVLARLAEKPRDDRATDTQ